MKKADLSLNTIVIAAIVLIVFVVMVLIFTGRIGGFTRGLQDCYNKGGTPADYRSDQPRSGCDSGYAMMFTYRSENAVGDKDDKVCCLKLT